MLARRSPFLTGKSVRELSAVVSEDRLAYEYSMMEYGVKNGAGFSVISGEIGYGKTTLVRHLLNNLEPSHTVGLVYNTHKDIADLLVWIMLAFGLPYEGLSKVALYDSFQRFLIEQYRLEKSVLKRF